MTTHRIEIEEQVNVSPERAFALFADHKRFGKLLNAPVRRVKDSEQADPNGLGSVRKIGIGPIGLEETIIRFEPDSVIEYTVTSLSLVRNHLGRIRFTLQGERQTLINYCISFDAIVPFTGDIIAKALEHSMRKGIRRVPALA
ncbi:MAG: SRPBCC family protein [Oleiphilaceae bacterium]|nr:SRPBCC family protein [Oleiphilaceae bacterium]